MKLKHLILATLLAANTSFAAHPYLGAGIGANGLPWNIHTEEDQRVDFNDVDVIYNVLGGYGGVISENFYLAGEVFVQGGGGVQHLSYGVSVLPGLVITEGLMAYMRAGVARTRFDYTEIVHRVEADYDKTVNGVQLGLGLDFRLTRNIDARPEYTYTYYQTFSGTAGNIRPAGGQVVLSLIYRFV